MTVDVDPRWWDDASVGGQPMREVLAARDVRSVFGFLRQRGFSRSRIAALTGLSETRVRQIWQGRQQVTTYEVLERIAVGLKIPRGLLGLAYLDPTTVDDRDGAPPAGHPPLGLGWRASLRDTVEAVSDLWRADVERRSVLHQSVWLAAAAAVPARDWLLDRLDDHLAAPGARTITHDDVQVIWTMCQAFTDADHRLGGGHARLALSQYVSAAVLPMLRGGYDEAVGRELMAGAARLCDLGGFMAFDSGLHGLGQRYYIQALRLAQAAHHRGLGAHILADMSMQAQHLGDAAEAAALATAGCHTAVTTGSKATVARCEAMLARALALASDRPGCEQAMGRADTALERIRPDDEPAWTGFFTRDQLDTEFAYAAADLGRLDLVRRTAPAVIAASGQMERRKVLLSATLARACLPEAHGAHSPGCDVEQACAVLTDVAPLMVTVTTERGRQAIGTVQQQLRPYATLPAVRHLTELFGSME